MKDVEYIIVQAGGRGSRLKSLTDNKPKCIVSVENLPIIFHLFRKYPDKKYVIIGDYKKNVLDRYLESFCDVQYLTVDASNHKGTCAGIKDALEMIPPKSRIMLIWSDLILDKSFEIPQKQGNYIGLSTTFPCRWSYYDNKLIEKTIDQHGVAGLFIFDNKKVISDVPSDGEFVRWLGSKKLILNKLMLNDVKEYGLAELIKPPESGKCRPFNKVTILDDKFIKEAVDDQGRKLAKNEIKWYQHILNKNVPIPNIYSFEPLTMELINGDNVFKYRNIDNKQKEVILIKIMNGLKSIHKNDLSEVDRFSMKAVYYDKTFDRLSKVRDLIPFAKEKIITVNGKKCRNPFFYKDRILELIGNIKCNNFSLIHGDCTFSNIMVRKNFDPVFIDPRGYFGYCELIGDPNYDWSKLYYSLYGDYDMFNLGKFSLKIQEKDVTLNIETNQWKNLEKIFIDNLPDEIRIEDIRLIHSLIWLSLTTYAWDDYDSICAAFYNGIYYLEDIL